jgi:Putative transposase
MTGVEVLARLAALIPPPRFPLVRYHGVIAPNSSWRKSIVPQPPAPQTDAHAHPSKDEQHVLPHEPKKKAATESRGSMRDKPKRARPQSDAVVEHHSNVTLASHKPQPPETTNLRYLAPNILSVQHWERLLGGLTYAATPRMAWATLLRRTFNRHTHCNWHRGGVRPNPDHASVPS